jgi:uroporphyrinogen decarboxylase
MTPRERWRALFAGERPDRVPCDYWATGEVTSRLLRDLNCATEADLFRRLGVDKCIYLAVGHPSLTAADWHFGMHSKIWHIGTRMMPYADGLGYYEEDAVHPLAEADSVADVDRFDWPTADTWDYSRLREQCLLWPDNPILCGTSEPFHLYCRLRGLERSLADLVERPDIAEAILEHIFAVDKSVHRRILDEVADLIDLVYISEDLGTQTSLLMSPRAFRRFFKPHKAALIEQAHAYGVKVMHHDDGANRPLLPDLVEIGIDILNPVQWRCPGMDREGLVRDFGDRLIFHGGVDNQQTLPFGTPDEVRQQVAENIRIFREAKGYIVASCHNLQPNTPTENIVAMYEAVEEFGWSS